MPLQNNQNPLAQLNDIQALSLPSFWPPAAIYWFLLSAVIIFLLLFAYLFKKYKKQKVKQKMALQQLIDLQQSNADFILLNQLLKGVALLYFPRTQVASLHGEQWFDFLQFYAKAPLFDNKQHFIKRLYNSPAPVCSSSDFEQARQWITSLHKQIKKTHDITQEKHNNV
jgi:leucyl aminopeptidase